MPSYPRPPSLGRMFADMQRRLRIAESQLAYRTQQTTPTAGNVYDANVIYNGAMDTGPDGFAILFFGGAGVGVLSDEMANPIDGSHSLRVDEIALADSRVFWIGTGSTVVGTDVFATAPGEQWLVSATLMSTVATTDAEVQVSTGLAATDVLALPGGNTTWTMVASGALTPLAPLTLSSTITVPASRNFIGLHVAANPSAASAVPWTWWLDLVSMQRKL